MKQVYEVKMKNREKAELHISIARRFNVSKSRLYEVTTGNKIRCPGKNVPEELELDTPADAQTSTIQEAKRCVDDLDSEKKAKKQKGDKGSKTKKSGKMKSKTQ